jgi:hypothetical protein
VQGHSYNPAERFLHYLALASKPVAEFSFDLNAVLQSRGPRLKVDGRHVFVSGLARAGTTIIMRRLYETGDFRSLTYRDMPFVLCPSLWQRISASAQRDAQAAERAHGDRLNVDFDSPEALDEVFWRVFAGSLYIKDDYLCVHAADTDLIEKFRRYVSYILDAQHPADRRSRYLSKNNNNILRLDAIRSAFPGATIIIPFRDPIQHANSLLQQHIRFSQLQDGDRFIRSYMSWLAHHEFGLAHKPFRFERRGQSEASSHEATDVSYWLERWLEAYAWLLANRPDTSILVCYEDLCGDPSIWNRLLERLELDTHGATSTTTLVRSTDKDVLDVDANLAAASRTLYGQLRSSSELSRGS